MILYRILYRNTYNFKMRPWLSCTKGVSHQHAGDDCSPPPQSRPLCDVTELSARLRGNYQRINFKRKVTKLCCAVMSQQGCGRPLYPRVSKDINVLWNFLHFSRFLQKIQLRSNKKEVLSIIYIYHYIHLHILLRKTHSLDMSIK